MDWKSSGMTSGGSVAATLLLGAFFAFLWLPLGQTPFLVANWMKLGAFCAPLIMGIALAVRPAGAEDLGADRQLLAVLLLALYMVHQVEEHWIDLTGHNYAFYDTANALLRGVCGPSLHAINPMSPETIFVINSTLVWLVGALAILRAPSHVFPLLALTGITLVNGLAHILGGLLQLAYNPGLATALILFVPVSTLVYRHLKRQDPALGREIMASIAWAGASHALMIAGVLASAGYGLVPVWLFWAALAAMAIVPSLLFRSQRNAARARMI